MWTTLVRAWLLVISAFEVPELYKFLVDEAKFDAFNSNLVSAPAERRLWGFVLVLLVLVRLLGVCAPDVRAVRVHVAVVHAAELLVFGSEKIFFGSLGEDAILAAIAFNAVLFSAWAIAGIKVKAVKGD